MIDHALALVSWESERSVDELKQALREGENCAHSSFRFALARVVAQEVGRLVREVYVYGSPLENRARMNSDIDLLVVVSGARRFAARCLDELDRGLVDEYKALIAPLGDSMNRLLDYHFVTRSDIRQRRGYAAILNDPYALRPERIYGPAVNAA
jgi:predicted nucleotidyltransferase